MAGRGGDKRYLDETEKKSKKRREKKRKKKDYCMGGSEG
jgi:hypothetical protein